MDVLKFQNDCRISVEKHIAETTSILTIYTIDIYSTRMYIQGRAAKLGLSLTAHIFCVIILSFSL